MGPAPPRVLLARQRRLDDATRLPSRNREAAVIRVHLVDGTYELFRAYFGAPKAEVEGREVGATRGILRSLLSLVRDDGVSHVGVAFDQVIESFRNELFSGYKTGEGIEPDLWSQFPL